MEQQKKVEIEYETSNELPPTQTKEGGKETKQSFPKKFEASYVFSDRISRLYLLLSDSTHLESLNKKTQLPFLFTDKPVPLNYDFCVSQMLSLEHNKSINWTITSGSIPVVIHEEFNLVKNTLDNTTLLTFALSVANPDKIDKNKRKKIINGCKKVCIEIINNIDILLQENSDNIFEYESTIIKINRAQVFDYIFDPIKFAKNFSNVLIVEGKNEVGTVVSWKTNDEDQFEFKSKIIQIDNDPKKKKWKYILAPISGPFQDQIIKFIFIEISNNETFFSVEHDFKEKVDEDDLNILKIKKAKMINFIKEKLECMK